MLDSPMQAAAERRPVALVTGAARRVGAVIARRLHGAGYDLALHYRHSDQAMRELCFELESARADSTLMLQGELTDEACPAALIQATVERFGRLDGLVNNASAYYATPLGGITMAQWQELFGANAQAPFFLAQAAAPHLKHARGAIVSIVDIYGERPLPGHAVYSMSKAALAMMTQALAGELGPQVRVNGVAPGNVMWSTNEIKAETETTLRERTALGRQGSPEDVADAVLFLLRDAHYTSGEILKVDGGRALFI